MVSSRPSASNARTAEELRGLKVLLLSYYFPPLASAGGHRNGAFARNLARHGARVTVVTVRHGLDVTDPALVEKIPPEVRVVRVLSFEGAKWRSRMRDRYKHDEPSDGAPSGLARRAAGAAAFSVVVVRNFIPWAFRRVLFGLAAARACRRAIRRERPDVLLTSLGPMCQTWAALLAVRGTGVPVAFDFRDLWTPAPEYHKIFLEHRATRPVRLIDRPVERWAMRRADLFVANHEHMARTIERLEPGAGERTVVVPNGYEEEDFAGLAVGAAPAKDGVRVVRSMGTTYGATVGPLAEAAGRLPAELAAKLRVELIGPYYELFEPGARDDGIQVVHVRTPLPHSLALREMAGADALLFLLRATPGIEDMVPARLYEYLRLGRPLLALAPPGAASELVERFGGSVVDPADVDGLAAALAGVAAGGPLPAAPDPNDPGVREFERSAQALALGRALAGLAGGRNR